MESLNTIIEFVSNGSGSGAQTSDMLGFVIAGIFAIAAVLAFCVNVYAKQKVTTTVGLHSVTQRTQNKPVSKILAIVFLAIALVAGVVSFTTNSTKAMAAQNNIAKSSATVKAMVDENTGEVTIENGFLNNTSTEKVNLVAVNVKYTDDVKITDNCLWQVKVGGSQVYNDIADRPVIGLEQVINNEVTSFAVSGMTADTAKSLIGKQVASVSFSVYKQESPTFIHNVTFDPDNGEDTWTVKVNDGEKVAQPKEDPEKEGFDFDCWQLNKKPYDFNTPVKNDITLKAHYTQSTPETATFTGKVENESGAGIAGVTVYFMDVDGNVIAETTTDANGNYTLEDVIDGASGWIKYESNKGENDGVVAPDYYVEFATAGESTPIDTKTATDKSTIEGYTVPAVAGQIIQFVTADGEVYTVITDVNGEYFNPVSADTEGNLYVPGYVLEQYLEEYIPLLSAPAGESIEQNVPMTLVSEASTFDGKLEGADIEDVIVSFSTEDGIVYETSTDEGGNYILPVPPNSKGVLSFSKEGILTIYNEVISGDTSASIIINAKTTLEKDAAFIEGQVDSGEAGVLVSFTTDYGQTYLIYTDTDGKYNLPVPPNSKGVLSFIQKGMLSVYKEVESNNTGESITVNPSITPAEDAAFIEGQASPSEEGILVTFTTDDGQFYLTYTDTDGKYNLPVPPNSNGILSFVKEGILTIYKELTTGGTGESILLDPKITPEKDAAFIEGQADSAEEGILVVFIANDNQTYSVYTDTDGKYKLPVPSNTKASLKFEKSGYLNIFVDVTSGNSGESSKIDPRITPEKDAAFIDGQVDPAEEGVLVSFTTDYGQTYYIYTNSDGKFKLPVPPNSKGILGFVKEGMLPVYKEVESGGTGVSVTVNPKITPEKDAAFIEGQADSGEEGILVIFITSEGQTYSTYTDTDGKYKLFVPFNTKATLKFEKSGNLSIYVEVESGGAGESITVNPKITSEEDAAFIEGQVNPGEEGVLVTFATGYGQSYITYTDKDGKYRLPVPPNSNGVLSFVKEGMLPVYKEVESGGTGVSITVNPKVTPEKDAAFIEGQADSGEEGILVIFSASDGQTYSTYTDKEGKYKFSVPSNTNGSLIFQKTGNLSVYVNVESGGAGESYTFNPKITAEKDAAFIEGQVNPGEEGVLVTFATDYGQSYITYTDKDGKYKLPVPPNSKGILGFVKDGMLPIYKEEESGGTGESITVNPKITPEIEAAFIEGQADSGEEGILVMFSTEEGQTYSSYTDKDGKYKFSVPSNTKASLIFQKSGNLTVFVEVKSSGAGESITVNPKITSEEEAAFIEGQVEPGVEGVIVTFTTDYGQSYITYTDKDGKYKLPVPPNTKGVLDIVKEGMLPVHKEVESGNTGASIIVNPKMTPESEASYLCGNVGLELPDVVVQFFTDDGQVYKTVTDTTGSYGLYVPAYTNGYVQFSEQDNIVTVKIRISSKGQKEQYNLNPEIVLIYESSTVSGKIEPLVAVQNAQVYFCYEVTDAYGNTFNQMYELSLDEDGNFVGSVPQEKSGYVVIENKDYLPVRISVTTEVKGGEIKLPNVSLERADDAAFFKGDAPNINCEVTFKTDDGAVYYADFNGKMYKDAADYSMKVPHNKHGVFEIYNPEADNEITYIKEMTSKDSGGSTTISIDFSKYSLITIDLNDGTIDSKYVPKGWDTSENVVKYVKRFVNESDISALLNAWDTTKLVAPENTGAEFSNWDATSGTVSKAQTIKALWNQTVTLQGDDNISKFTDVSGEITYPEKNKVVRNADFEFKVEVKDAKSYFVAEVVVTDMITKKETVISPDDGVYTLPEVKSNLKVTAKSEEYKDYTVTLDLDGGSVSGTVPHGWKQTDNNYQRNYKGPYSIESIIDEWKDCEFTKTDWVFAGWDPKEGQIYKDTTIKAKWRDLMSYYCAINIEDESATMDNPATLTILGGTKDVLLNLWYKKGKVGEWTNLRDMSWKVTDLVNGDTVYLKGENFENTDHSHAGFSTKSNTNSIWVNKKYTVSGEATSLIYGDNKDESVVRKLPEGSERCFYSLFGSQFNDSNLLSISEDFLPFTSLNNNSCYGRMFIWCTNLTSVPLLPAKILTDECYNMMFDHCSSLTLIPENLLQAEKLAPKCYEYMFDQCSSLESIPENLLPVEILCEHCYFAMFANCSKLTSIPEKLLPSNTLAECCYGKMFSECSSLVSIPKNLLPAEILSNNCYESMFQTCTNLKSIPEDFLPAKTTALYCYQYMFESCFSLTTVPNNLLPALSVEANSYNYMFAHCSKLESLPENFLPATKLSVASYANMFLDCSSLELTNKEEEGKYLVFECPSDKFSDSTDDMFKGVPGVEGTPEQGTKYYVKKSESTTQVHIIVEKNDNVSDQIQEDYYYPESSTFEAFLNDQEDLFCIGKDNCILDKQSYFELRNAKTLDIIKPDTYMENEVRYKLVKI